MRDLDVVVYGATGFTGRLVAAYLAARVKSLSSSTQALRVGLAGRCSKQLCDVRDAAAATSGHTACDPPLVVAAADDTAALNRLVGRARVVLSTAGPFSVCGTPLVRACVQEGTDYLDINGEVPISSHPIPSLPIPSHSIPSHPIHPTLNNTKRRQGVYHALRCRPTPHPPHHTIPYHTIPYHTTPNHTIPHHTMPSYECGL